MRSSRAIWMGLLSHDKSPCKRHTEKTQGEKGEKGRDWSFAATSQGHLKPPEAGTAAKDRFSPRAFRV